MDLYKVAFNKEKTFPPKCKNKKKSVSVIHNENKDESNSVNLSKLVEPCLYHICKYLSFKDHVNLLAVSKQFKYAIPNMRNFRLNPETVKGLSFIEISTLIQVFGKQIEYINLNNIMGMTHYEFQNLLKEISQNCTDIKELELKNLVLVLDDNFEIYDYEQILKNLIDLLELTVRINPASAKNSNQLFELIRIHCKNVETLAVRNFCSPEIAKSIGEMESLKDLKFMNYYFSIGVENITNFVNIISMSNLAKQLEILTLGVSIYNSFSLIKNTLPINLMQLINKFENLNEIRLVNFQIINFDVIDELFENMGNIKNVILKYVDIKFDCILHIINYLTEPNDLLLFAFDTIIKNEDFKRILENPVFMSSHKSPKFMWKFIYYSIPHVQTLTLCYTKDELMY